MKPILFDLSAQTLQGGVLDMSAFRGHPVLIVNTASKCGFTPQYQGLEDLYRKYKDQGLVVIGFPCDQFGHQEPGTPGEIATFCAVHFGVTFPLMAKIHVNGPFTHPIFHFLKDRARGFLFRRIKWNFTKFLVFPDGSTVQRFSPMTRPRRLEKSIENVLRITAH